MPKAIITSGESRVSGHICKGLLANMGFEAHLVENACAEFLMDLAKEGLDLLVVDSVRTAIDLRKAILGKIAILAVINDPYAEEEAAAYDSTCRKIHEDVRKFRQSMSIPIPDDDSKKSAVAEKPPRGRDMITSLLKNQIGFFYKKHGEHLDTNKMQEAILTALALVGQPLPPIAA